MSDQITFTGCVLKSFSRGHSGGKANFSANFKTPMLDEQRRIATSETDD